MKVDSRYLGLAVLLLISAATFSLQESLSAPAGGKNARRAQVESKTEPTLTDPIPVVEVIDGDTIRVLWKGKLRLVRLQGIDAPERKINPRTSIQARTHQTTPEKVTKFGERSLGALKTLVGKSPTVRLEFDEENVDDFGRLLAYVYVGEKMLNREMLRLGYAEFYVFPPNDRYYADFKATYRLSKDTKRGLWAFGDYEYQKYAPGKRERR